MSFSSLPPELVHQIIESTVPHTFHSTTYRKRQDILCRLSLVSRQFRSIAQPLLFEIAWIRNNDQLKLILGDDGKVVAHQLVLQVWRGLYSDVVGNAIGGSLNIRSLTIQSDQGDVLDLSGLSSCEDLVNLQLSGDRFDATSLDSLPSLQALSLNYLAAQTVHGLLDPRKVPALKALGLENIDLEHELDDLKNTSIEKLLPQLDALCMDISLYKLAKDTALSKIASRSLVNASPDEILYLTEEALSRIRHLRIKLDHFLLTTDRFDAVRPLAQVLEFGQQSKPRQLRSIYLNPDVRPGPSDAKEAHEEFAKLEEVCREAGVDLVFEVQGQDYDWDSYISPEFCRRQRKHT